MVGTRKENWWLSDQWGRYTHTHIHTDGATGIGIAQVNNMQIPVNT